MYEAPAILDLGSIGKHTFGRSTDGGIPNPGGNIPPKDTNECEDDPMEDWSCPAGSP